ncbi:hypothetical protein OnM2_016004 [Erysiphe neolycopersici]|uniref:DRBM domain-containing protein n=1 Tax=Erysiphe neolycopersici TaxID=212602 RepID=A0A420I547_9PEZI|nr:hypothetical protein OnM2_016004 [Erysiphe neolycopersici]
MAGHYETKLEELSIREKWRVPKYVKWQVTTDKFVYELYAGEKCFRGEMTEGDENAKENVAQMAYEEFMGIN